MKTKCQCGRTAISIRLNSGEFRRDICSVCWAKIPRFNDVSMTQTRVAGIHKDDIASLLANVMGWGKRTSNIPGFLSPSETPYEQWANGPFFEGRVFQPCISHDDAQIAVEKCFRKDLEFEYCNALVDIWGEDAVEESRIPIACLLSTPEQKSRAALAALTGASQ